MTFAETGCHWHTHSLFRRCANGLTLTEYLALAELERRKA